MIENTPSTANESPAIPTDFSDYSHYILYEKHGDDEGTPVYQSMSTGMLFGEDATPLIYVEDRLLDMEALARGMIEVLGRTEQLERIANSCVTRKEHFTRVLEMAKGQKD